MNTTESKIATWKIVAMAIVLAVGSTLAVLFNANPNF